MKVFKVWSSIIAGLLLSSIVMTGCGNSAPSAPTGVTANPGNGEVTIAWPSVGGASSYNIYYATFTGVTPANGNLISGETSPYTQAGLTNGTTYFFVVTAVDGNGDESAASTQVSCTPTLPVTATPGDSQVTIAWPEVSGATSYNIYYSTSSGVTPGNGTPIYGVAAGAATPSYTQMGLTDGTTYFFVVTSKSGNNESAPSTQVIAIPSVNPAPAEPVGVSVIPGNGQASISWSAVPSATSYNIYWSSTPGVTTTTGRQITGVTTTSYTQTGLTDGTIYYYVITAVNSTNGSESTASIQVSVAPSN
jgi:fibronectin type 3 domain-containing protein